MSRALLALSLGLLAAGVAQADGLPPKGLKTVPVDHKFTTEKEWADYDFFAVSGGKGPRAKLTALTISPKTPGVFPGAGRTGIGRLGTLYAVPKSAARNFDSEAKFHDAIKLGKVEGIIATTTRLDSQTAIKDTDQRTVVVREHRIEKIDANEGIVLATKKDEDRKPGGGKDSPDDGEDVPGVTAYVPRGGLWVAGLAAFAAITLGGLWLAGRSRRKV